MPSDSFEPPFNSHEPLVELYRAVLGAWSPSEQRDRRIATLMDDIGRYLGVPDA